MKYRYALLLLICALMLGGGAAFMVVGLTREKPLELTAAQAVPMTVEAPHEVTIWYYTEMVTEAGDYVKWEEPPEGIRLTVTHEGATLPLRVDRGTTVSMGDGERRSLFEFDATTPGTYLLRADNLPAGLRLVASQGSGIGRLLLAIGLLGAASLVMTGAVVMFILAIANVFPKTKR